MKPPKGQSGSGYTRIPNGKLVRNKRPATKSLPVRQAKNWRSRATTDLVAFLKERGIGSDDPKPVGDANYRALVLDLEYSKAYFAYVKGEDEPVEVQDWKSSHPPPTRPRSASPRGSATGQLAKVSSDTKAGQPASANADNAQSSDEEDEEKDGPPLPPSQPRSPVISTEQDLAPATRSKATPAPKKGKGKA